MGALRFMVHVVWARLRRKSGDEAETRRGVEDGMREFRAAYAELDPEKEEMIRSIVPLVMALVAVGASEQDLVAILAAIVAGETDPERLADCTNGRLKADRAEIVAAVHGRVTSHHRFFAEAAPGADRHADRRRAASRAPGRRGLAPFSRRRRPADDDARCQ